MKRLQGKVAIVTASTAGIGLAIAQRLAEEGASVVISSRKEENVKEAVEQLRKLNLEVLGVKCHVADANDRKRLFEETIQKYGKLNILISNAAVNPVIKGGVFDSDEKSWDKIFDVNVKASYLLAKEATPYLRLQPKSNIIFVSSASGYEGTKLMGVYAVSKTTLFGLTKALAKDLGPSGIRVNCLAPGLVETRFAQSLTTDDSATNYILGRSSIRRFGQPHEMAGIVACLVSDDGTYITGESIAVSGGWHSRL